MSWSALLPIEPCAKARPRVTRRGTYMPKSYMEWRRRFVALCNKDDLHRALVPGPLSIIVIVYTKSGKMRPDLDNVGAACLDALQDAGVIENDRDAVRLTFILDKDKKPGIDITVDTYA